MNFTGSNILSVNQFDRDSIDYIFSVADKMQPYARRKKRTRVLDGAILGNLFFEPSTRTRVSFGTAFNLLGGEVRETTGMESSAIAKGESLYDTARVLSSYSDVIAMRHPKSGSVKEFASGSRVPVIGDLKYGRTVHSLSTLLSMYKNIKFTLISPRELSMPESVLATLENAGHQVTVTEKVDGIVDADIVYQTRIQQERFASPEDADQYRGKFRLNQEIYTKHYKPNTVIMHPLPRDSRAEANELDNDLNQNPNLAIFRQADNGVLIRMALFALTLGVVDQVDKHECDVIWYSEKSQL